jgi:hypothetical protein
MDRHTCCAARAIRTSALMPSPLCVAQAGFVQTHSAYHSVYHLNKFAPNTSICLLNRLMPTLFTCLPDSAVQSIYLSNRLAHTMPRERVEQLSEEETEEEGPVCKALHATPCGIHVAVPSSMSCTWAGGYLQTAHLPQLWCVWQNKGTQLSFKCIDGRCWWRKHRPSRSTKCATRCATGLNALNALNALLNALLDFQDDPDAGALK